MAIGACLVSKTWSSLSTLSAAGFVASSGPVTDWLVVTMTEESALVLAFGELSSVSRLLLEGCAEFFRSAPVFGSSIGVFSYATDILYCALF